MSRDSLSRGNERTIYCLSIECSDGLLCTGFCIGWNQTLCCLLARERWQVQWNDWLLQAGSWHLSEALSCCDAKTAFRRFSAASKHNEEAITGTGAWPFEGDSDFGWLHWSPKKFKQWEESSKARNCWYQGQNLGWIIKSPHSRFTKLGLITLLFIVVKLKNTPASLVCNSKCYRIAA